MSLSHHRPEVNDDEATEGLSLCHARKREVYFKTSAAKKAVKLMLGNTLPKKGCNRSKGIEVINEEEIECDHMPLPYCVYTQITIRTFVLIIFYSGALCTQKRDVSEDESN